MVEYSYLSNNTKLCYNVLNHAFILNIWSRLEIFGQSYKWLKTNIDVWNHLFILNIWTRLEIIEQN